MNFKRLLNTWLGRFFISVIFYIQIKNYELTPDFGEIFLYNLSIEIRNTSRIAVVCNILKCK